MRKCYALLGGAFKKFWQLWFKKDPASLKWGVNCHSVACHLLEQSGTQETGVNCCLVHSLETEHMLLLRCAWKWSHHTQLHGNSVSIRMKLGEDARQIQVDLNQILGRHCPSHCTVARWALPFKNERESSEDDQLDVFPCHGARKILLLSDEGSMKIDIQQFLLLAMISDSTGSIHLIIHEHLKMRKVYSLWLPHLLSDNRNKRSIQCASPILYEFITKGHKQIKDVVASNKQWFYFF